MSRKLSTSVMPEWIIIDMCFTNIIRSASETRVNALVNDWLSEAMKLAMNNAKNFFKCRKSLYRLANAVLQHGGHAFMHGDLFQLIGTYATDDRLTNGIGHIHDLIDRKSAKVARVVTRLTALSFEKVHICGNGTGRESGAERFQCGNGVFFFLLADRAYFADQTL